MTWGSIPVLVRILALPLVLVLGLAPLQAQSQDRRQVFLSYARKDLPYANRAHRILSDSGCQVWWDRQVSPGMDWIDSIDRAIRSASVIVVLVGTPCRGCRGEYLTALDLKKPVVPVKLWPRAQVPWILRPLQSIPFSSLPDLCRPPPLVP